MLAHLLMLHCHSSWSNPRLLTLERCIAWLDALAVFLKWGVVFTNTSCLKCMAMFPRVWSLS